MLLQKGTVTSYGFQGSTLLQSQNYESCIRQEAGTSLVQGVQQAW